MNTQKAHRGIRWVLVPAIVGLSLTLSACAPLLIGGAAASAMVANDRRTSGTFVEDASIELKLGNKISAALGERARVSVTSFNRRVLLTGEVATPTLKTMAAELAKNSPNVELVVNELVVAAKASATQLAADTLLSSRVKFALVSDNGIDASATKVITERGQVYLMGMLTEGEAQKVTEVVRRVSGVQGVVRVVEIISEQQLLEFQRAAQQRKAQQQAQ